VIPKPVKHPANCGIHGLVQALGAGSGANPVPDLQAEPPEILLKLVQ